MRHKDGEVDFLALAQPKDDPKAFRQLVREAFALEYQTTKDGQIAEIVGRDKSRVSQVLNDPAGVEAATIKHLVSFLSSVRHRRRIIDAWSRLYFAGITEKSPIDSILGAEATERTRRRVDRLIREGQLVLAARVCIEAIAKTEDRNLQEEFLDRAYFAYQRLDLPGQAMRIVRIMASRARARGDFPRELGVNLFRVRIMLGLADVKPDEVFPIIDQAIALIEGWPDQNAQRHLVGTRQLFVRMRDMATITFIERGFMPPDEGFVRALLQCALNDTRTSKGYRTRSKHLFMAARCHLILGEHLMAEELLERSFKSGDLKNLNALEVSGLMQSRIQAHRVPLEFQSEYLLEVSKNCSQSHDRYHQRLAEWDLVRVEGKLFPANEPD